MRGTWSGIIIPPYPTSLYTTSSEGVVVAGILSFRGLFVIDQHDEIFHPLLLDPVRASGPRQHGGAGSDIEGLAVDSHRAVAAQHVIDFVLFLFVIANPRSRLQRPLPKHERQPWCLVEKRVADRLPAAVVRTGLGLPDVRLVLHDVATRRSLVGRRRLRLGGSGDQSDRDDEQRKASHDVSPLRSLIRVIDVL